MLSSGNKQSKVTILGSAILHYYCSNTSRRNLKFGITIGHKIWPILHQYMKQNSNLDPKGKKTRHHQGWWQAHLWTKSDFPEEGRHWAYYNRVCLWRTEKQVRQSQKKNQITLINVLVTRVKKQRWLSWKKSLLACFLSLSGSTVPDKLHSTKHGFAVYQGV